MKPLGRPTKQTDATCEKILKALRGGCTLKAACGYAGISENTLSRMKETFADFGDRIACAEAEAERTAADRLFRAGARDWRAAESWLKRRRSADWGDKQTTELTGKDGGPITLALNDSLSRIYGEQEPQEDESQPEAP